MSKSKDKHPVTYAISALKQAGVVFMLLPKKYEERGGTRHSAAELGIDESRMITTLIM